MTHFCLEVSGPFACFTRPEMKVERVSYDVMTPSAARSIFEAILWKPAIRWRVHRIEVLKPIRWINLRRNEVSAVVSTRNVQHAMTAGHGQLALYIEDERQQRAGYFLRDVAYRIHADLALALGCNEPLMKYTEMFVRRATKGQCVNQPYLGCREFAAAFNLVTPDAPTAAPIGETRELGWMLHDLDFTHPSDPQPRFFNAKMVAGVVEV
ncbi:MAG: type I-C CRISPR-associated protein Cas5, partial [Candidatus Saccharibacteria bacterium]|nr:type I-C CRISPR-associated protein Cas5 [Rhodoferax sp.]